MNTWLPTRNYWVSRTTSFQLEVDIYAALGNTGTAVHRSLQGLEKTLQGIDNCGHIADVSRAEIEALFKGNPNTAVDLIGFHHPDPKLAVKQDIKDPRLQVMGSWKKIQDISNPIESRQGFSSFVWNSESPVCPRFICLIPV